MCSDLATANRYSKRWQFGCDSGKYVGKRLVTCLIGEQVPFFIIMAVKIKYTLLHLFKN